jgi:hypothetical protein
LGRIAIDQCNPLLRALGVPPLGFVKGLLDDVCHRLRQRGPYPFGFRPWSGRCGEVCWPQLPQDVGGGTHPWCNRIVRLSQNSRFSTFNGAKRLRCFQ